MADDEDLIRRCLRELGLAGVRLDHYASVTGAGSGSRVFRLAFDSGADPVLKVTTSPERQPARRELAFYTRLAGRIPLRTPAMLGAADNEELTCLLLEAAHPSPPAPEWTTDQWLLVAAQLGELHRPEVLQQVVSDDWLGHAGWPPPGYVTQAAGTARRQWRELGHGDLTDPLFDQLEELAAALHALPECLLHGDCHLANLLLGKTTTDLIWTDWQATTRGRGPEDLALLWSRANADGGRPPVDEMRATYAGVRGLPDDDLLHRALLAGRLRLELFGWPERLPHFDTERRRCIVGQLARLAAQW